MVALAISAAWGGSAHAGGVIVGSEKGAEHKEAIDAARSVAPEFSFADEDSPDAADQLRHADVILAVGARALTMARSVAPEKPVVYAMVPAAEAMPGKSVTGVVLEVPAYAEFAQWKQLRFDGQRVGLLFDPKASASFLPDATRAATALGLALVPRPCDDAAHAATAVAELATKVDAVWVAAPFAEAAAKWSGKVALFGSDEKTTAMGALFSLAPDARDIGRRAARMALGILNRALDQRLPVPPPSTSPGALLLNAKTAQALGIELPDQLVKKARKIFH
ncbi:MAG: transporter substrate-binding protein [Myxococcales bacterium]|nr:transporter substrate-binding protein [Myxococcales bacterium]